MQGSVQELIDLFARMPGIGRRNATRLVFHLIDATPQYVSKLGENISSFHSKIKKCSSCANISDIDPCHICNDNQRDETTICVVENIPDLWALENGGTYRGAYHVLHGLLAPLDGIGPEDLNLNTLQDRVKHGNIKEIIVATRPSVEGEATAMLVRHALDEFNGIKISRIASGIPHGSELEYTDARTLERALEDRREF